MIINRNKKKKPIWSFIKLYSFCVLIALFILITSFYDTELSFKDNSIYTIRTLTSKDFFIFFNCCVLLIFLIINVWKYLRRIYYRNGFTYLLKKITVFFLLPAMVIIIVLRAVVIYNLAEDYNYVWDYVAENDTGEISQFYDLDNKHRGVTIFGLNHIDSLSINHLIRTNVEWVAIVPFITQDSEASYINSDSALEQPNENTISFIKTIKILKREGFRVHLKPHIWIRNGWRGDISHSNQENWDKWFESYSNAILQYAKIAAINDVDLFCIGTELDGLLKNNYSDWLNLISRIKEVYSGKLTYAANWSSVFEIQEIWHELDYIGIQGYFPITSEKNPELALIINQWTNIKNNLELLSKLYNKPILFTEIGYKSSTGTLEHPWKWQKPYINIFTSKKSYRLQQLAYEGMFGSLWKEKWFSGTYIWKWNMASNKTDIYSIKDFSPKFKPAENIITKWYGSKELRLID